MTCPDLCVASSSQSPQVLHPIIAYASYSPNIERRLARLGIESSQNDDPAPVYVWGFLSEWWPVAEKGPTGVCLTGDSGVDTYRSLVSIARNRGMVGGLFGVNIAWNQYGNGTLEDFDMGYWSVKTLPAMDLSGLAPTLENLRQTCIVGTLSTFAAFGLSVLLTGLRASERRVALYHLY
jgi:hypothetical protein